MKRILWRRFGFQNLLFWLFVYLVVNPFLTTIPHSRAIFQLLLTIVLLFAIFAVHKEKGVLALSITLLSLTLLFHWLGIFGVLRFSAPVGHLIMIMYLATLVYTFLGVFSGPQK